MKEATVHHAYDIIPDLHGHHRKLVRLLDTLGYRPHGGSRRHPGGRKVVFLGDFIDRGPAIRETLHTVRGMVEAGDALAIAGNHEFNAAGFHACGPDGRPLRKHSERNVRNHAATLRAFAGLDAEWKEWLGWLGGLPLFRDFGALRAVHACWSDDAIAVLRGARLGDERFLRAAHRAGSPEKRAIDCCLKGPEVDLPKGKVFRDKDGIERRTIRTRWWNLRPGLSLGDVCMPVGMDCPARLMPRHLRRIPSYPVDAPPVFFGHYWLPPRLPRRPIRDNLVCLDYSAGLGGPLVACRWNGPRPEEWEFIESPTT